jgi:hypothetical protein
MQKAADEKYDKYNNILTSSSYYISSTEDGARRVSESANGPCQSNLERIDHPLEAPLETISKFARIEDKEEYELVSIIQESAREIHYLQAKASTEADEVLQYDIKFGHPEPLE